MFDAATLVALQCGLMTNKGIAFLMDEGEQEEYGMEECRGILKICSRLPHIQSSGFNSDSRMAHRDMRCIKKATRKAVWDMGAEFPVSKAEFPVSKAEFPVSKIEPNQG
eukprot:gene10445-11538_t